MANPIESTPKIRKQNTKKINKIGLGGGGKQTRAYLKKQSLISKIHSLWNPGPKFN